MAATKNSPTPPVGYEEEYEEPAPDALVGGPPATEDDSELSGILADLACATLKLGMLLAEADEDRWAATRGRLGTFLSLVQQLPDKPRPQRRVGFRVQLPKAKRRK